MTTVLAHEHCISCNTYAQPLSDQEQQTLLSELPGWQLIDHNGVKQLMRPFKFSNFQEALNFANQVGELAETANHHPAILVEWGRVAVTWWTHKIHGLHRNDFILAARTEQLPVIVNAP